MLCTSLVTPSQPVPIDQTALRVSKSRCEFLCEKRNDTEKEINNLQRRISQCHSGKRGKERSRSLKRLLKISQSRYEELSIEILNVKAVLPDENKEKSLRKVNSQPNDSQKEKEPIGISNKNIEKTSQIFIKNITSGNVHTLNVNLKTTVLNTRKLIASECFNTSNFHYIKIIFSGKLLFDEDTLDHYGIKKSTTLLIISMDRVFFNI